MSGTVNYQHNVNDTVWYVSSEAGVQKATITRLHILVERNISSVVDQIVKLYDIVLTRTAKRQTVTDPTVIFAENDLSAALTYYETLLTN